MKCFTFGIFRNCEIKRIEMKVKLRGNEMKRLILYRFVF